MRCDRARARAAAARTIRAHAGARQACARRPRVRGNALTCASRAKDDEEEPGTAGFLGDYDDDDEDEGFDPAAAPGEDDEDDDDDDDDGSGGGDDDDDDEPAAKRQKDS